MSIESELETRWRSHARTHRGNRRPTNEDSVLDESGAAMWVVADGMGGHLAGDVASQKVVEALSRIPSQATLGALVDCVEDTLLDVNDELRDHARQVGQTVGSTVVVMLARGAVGAALWAGDSRLYRLRGADVELVTRDHNPVADLMDDGLVSESVAMRAETNVVTRAIGGQSNLALDVALFDIREDDTFLLCSDGLYRELSEQQIVRQLKSRRVERAVDGLIGDCLAGAARDNVSVVVSRAVAQAPSQSSLEGP